MGVEPPPKCVNRELNSQIYIRSQDSHFSESDAHCVRYVDVMRMTIHAQQVLP